MILLVVTNKFEIFVSRVLGNWLRRAAFRGYLKLHLPKKSADKTRESNNAMTVPKQYLEAKQPDHWSLSSEEQH